MTLLERAASFASAFPRWPAAWPHLVEEQGRQVLYATWVLGNDYRTRSALYGAYPHGYLPRVMALFPDAAENVLHAFSGSLPAGPYSRIDLMDRCGVPDLRFHQADVCAAGVVFAERQPFRLILADPPYSTADAARYATPMVNRRKAIAALAQVAAPGAHLVWLDCVWPMHSKRQWVTVGRILVQRSTNHRVRVASIFERVAA
ncbi:MAG: hypothetical protein AB7Q29_14970 [Vicinamibacterales bacterium]